MILLMLVFVNVYSYSQNLEDFYKRRDLGFTIVSSTFNSSSSAYKSMQIKNPSETYKNKFSEFSLPLLLLDLPEAVNKKQWGFHYQARVLIYSDLWGVILKGKEAPKDNFLTSWMNMRLGLNFYAKDKIVVRGGIGGGVWAFTSLGSVYDPNLYPENKYKDILFTYGPYVGVDYAITNWLAVRAIGELNVGTVLNSNGDGKQKYKSPTIYVMNLELFTKYGFFIGLDKYAMPKVKDYIYDNATDKMKEVGSSFKYSRTDFVLGWKLNLW
ncbi:MAG: hypothetical protein A2X12_02315 [Bacteroidetes bacterium GWE2_29_8]|nr:MAG: hypothetical protein A2X12_02315 [Bacteroidetes bacterium GWE2_29_8]